MSDQRLCSSSDPDPLGASPRWSWPRRRASRTHRQDGLPARQSLRRPHRATRCPATHDVDLDMPGASRVSDMIVVGPTGNRERLPAPPGRTDPGYGIVAQRSLFDTTLQRAAVAAGAELSAGRADEPISDDRGRVAGFSLSSTSPFEVPRSLSRIRLGVPFRQQPCERRSRSWCARGQDRRSTCCACPRRVPRPRRARWRSRSSNVSAVSGAAAWRVAQDGTRGRDAGERSCLLGR
jgi:hypothetical protein